MLTTGQKRFYTGNIFNKMQNVIVDFGIQAGDPKRNRPLIESPPGENISSPGDSISAKCEMSPPGGKIISRPSSRKSPPL